MDFDLELAKKEAPDNPVYYIQYAFARISSIMRNARESGIDPDDMSQVADYGALTEEAELQLARTMLRFRRWWRWPRATWSHTTCRTTPMS